MKPYKFIVLLLLAIFGIHIESNATEATRTKLQKWYNEGTEAYNQKDYQTALNKFYTGVQWSRSFNDRAYMAIFLGNVGMVYQSQRYPEAALGYYIHALLITREFDNDKLREGIILANIGGAYTSFGQYSQALETYQEALMVNQSTGNKNLIAMTLNGMGMVYAAQRQYKKALIHYTQALALRQELEDLPGEQETMANITKAYVRKLQDMFSQF